METPDRPAVHALSKLFLHTFMTVNTCYEAGLVSPVYSPVRLLSVFVMIVLGV